MLAAYPKTPVTARIVSFEYRVISNRLQNAIPMIKRALSKLRSTHQDGCVLAS